MRCRDQSKLLISYGDLAFREYFRDNTAGMYNGLLQHLYFKLILGTTLMVCMTVYNKKKACLKPDVEARGDEKKKKHP